MTMRTLWRGCLDESHRASSRGVAAAVSDQPTKVTCRRVSHTQRWITILFLTVRLQQHDCTRFYCYAELDYPWRDGKAELVLVAWLNASDNMVYPRIVTHFSTNWAWGRVSLLLQPNVTVTLSEIPETGWTQVECDARLAACISVWHTVYNCTLLRTVVVNLCSVTYTPWSIKKRATLFLAITPMFHGRFFTLVVPMETGINTLSRSYKICNFTTTVSLHYLRKI